MAASSPSATASSSARPAPSMSTAPSSPWRPPPRAHVTDTTRNGPILTSVPPSRAGGLIGVDVESAAREAMAKFVEAGERLGCPVGVAGGDGEDEGFDQHDGRPVTCEESWCAPSGV